MVIKAASVAFIIIFFLIDSWYMLQTHHERDLLLFFHILSFGLMTAITVKIILHHSSVIQSLTSSITFQQSKSAEETKQLNILLDSLPCAVATISPDFTVMAVNKKVTSLTGFSSEVTVGQKCFKFFGDNVGICPGCPVRMAYQTGTVQQNLKHEKTAAGDDIFIEQTAIPILGTEGGIRHVLEIVIDATKRVKLENEKGQLFVQTVGALSKLIESRDYYTGAHSLGVENLAISIGRELGADPSVISEISMSALLHDIGKIGIMESILNKPGKLTPEEYAVIQKHPEIGYHALKNIQSLQLIAEDILHHHERFDGCGYPLGKKGEEIPLVSRILSVADAYEAITADRVYRKAMTPSQAAQIMLDGRGTQFDPQVVDALFRVVDTSKSAEQTQLENIR